jgi:hypothetical protein
MRLRSISQIGGPAQGERVDALKPRGAGAGSPVMSE